MASERSADAAAAVRRGFVDIAEGQVHYREAGWQHRREAGWQHRAVRPTLVLLHASPGSAKGLEPLLRELGRHRHVLAPDTLGNGDSCAPVGEAPDIATFADAHRRAIEALGLGTVDLYGSHTGANIACEIAIARPDRVRRLILDGVSLYGADEREDMLRHYAPGVRIDHMGSQLHWIWHFVRDVYLFWPWYRPQAENRRAIGLPDADELHDKVVEVLKAARTYHLAYRAAIAHDKAPRLPLVRVPTLLACAETDMFLRYFDAVRALMPEARPLITRGLGSAAALADTARHFEAFLDEGRETHA